MLPREVQKLLWDVLDYASYIEETIAGRTAEEYANDRGLRYSVFYALQTVGEALRQVERLDPSIGTRLTGYRQISGLRNRLVHGYGAIDPDIVWRIIHAHLPLLLSEVRALLDD